MKRTVRPSTLLVAASLAAVACSQPEPPAPAPAASPALTATGTVSVGTPPPTTMAAAAPAAQPPSANALATADGEKAGLRAEITELKRASGGTVSLKFTMVNDSDAAVSFGYDYVDPKNEVTDFGGIGGVHLIDPVGKKKYFVARDSEGKCVCSQKVADIRQGSRANLWARFPAPPDDVDKISVVIPHFSPMDDVPLSR